MNIITDHYTLIHGDALEILPTLTGMDCLVSDPPYPLSSGGSGECAEWRKMQGVFRSEQYDNGGALFESIPDWSEFIPLFYECLRADSHAYIMANDKNQFEMQAQAPRALPPFAPAGNSWASRKTSDGLMSRRGDCRIALRTWENRQWIYSRFDGKIVATLTGFQSFVRESPAVMFIHCAGGFPDDRARERNHARRQPPVSQTYLER